MFVENLYKRNSNKKIYTCKSGLLDKTKPRFIFLNGKVSLEYQIRISEFVNKAVVRVASYFSGYENAHSFITDSGPFLDCPAVRSALSKLY